jgi:hypothetical protein
VVRLVEVNMFLRPILLAILLALPAAAQPQGLRSVSPKEHNEPVVNPYMGWGLWAGPRYFNGQPFTIEYNTTGFGDDAPLFSYVLVDWMWADLEPEDGAFYWKDLDTVVDYWATRGKQIYLRVWVTDDPGWDGAPGNEVCPEWLWKAGAPYREYLAQGKFKKREPDYLHPAYETAYLPRLRRLLTALAERYDKRDSPIVLWGAMGYGQFGEWHTLGSKYPWPSREAKHKVLAGIVNMYADVFHHRPSCVSYIHDTDVAQNKSLEDHMYSQALDVAVANGFALAFHGFIDGTSTFIRFEKKVMETYWRQRPILSESNWSYTDVKNHRTHGTLDEYLEVYPAWHTNFAHYYMDADSYRRAMREDRAHFERGLQSGGIGYRLALTSASWPPALEAGHLFVIRQTWVNRNAGRLYVKHPLAVYLTDARGNVKLNRRDDGFDPTGWVKGETYPVISVIPLPKNLAPGEYDVRIALVDHAGKPRIRLAIEGEDSEMRYVLGKVVVLPAEAVGR